MKCLLAVLIVVAPLVSSDRMADLDWLPTSPTSQQFSPLTWLSSVFFQTCGVNKACPAGITCNIYEPCTASQGWCDQCQPPYYRRIDAGLNFVCALPSKLINANCTMKGECYSLSSCDLTGSLTCKCPLGTKANSDNTVCVNDYPNMVTIGGICTVSYQCGNSAQCGADRTIAGNSNQCACYPGYKPANNNIDCVAMMPGDACTTTTVSNAQCTGTTFQCMTGFTYVNTYQTGDMTGDIIFGPQTGPACVSNSGSVNLGLNSSCSATNVCSPQLFCEQCATVTGSVCQGQAVLTVTPLSTSTTTAAPMTCSATSVMYTSLVIIGAALLAPLLH